MERVVKWAVQSARAMAEAEAQQAADADEGGKEEDVEMDKTFDAVEEWDPEQGCVRDYRILKSRLVKQVTKAGAVQQAKQACEKCRRSERNLC